MESEQHPLSSSSLLSHQHDFSSLVSWPDHWQPESFEITTTNPSHIASNMTQVVPEHVARAKLGGGENDNSQKENNSTQNRLPQRSNSATLSTISVVCDTDTSIRSRPEQPPTKKSSIMFNTTNNIAASHSTSALTNVSIIRPSSFSNHHHHQQSRETSISTSSEMNIVHEKSHLTASTMSIPNKHSIKTTTTAVVGGTLTSTKNLSMKHKSTSFDDHRSTRGIGRSVLEHLVFVFPENVRRILAGPKK